MVHETCGEKCSNGAPKKNSINNIFVSYDVDTKLWFNLSAF